MALMASRSPPGVLNLEFGLCELFVGERVSDGQDDVSHCQGEGRGLIGGRGDGEGGTAQARC
jgi:hypothetical protein